MGPWKWEKSDRLPRLRGGALAAAQPWVTHSKDEEGSRGRSDTPPVTTFTLSEMAYGWSLTPPWSVLWPASYLGVGASIITRPLVLTNTIRELGR